MLIHSLKSLLRIEKKSLGDPTEEEIAIFTGGITGKVSLDTALTVPAVQSAIRVISEAAASLEPRVMMTSEGGEVQVKDHPVAQLLAGQPNSWSSTYELIRDLVATALCYDKGAVAWVSRVDGDIREIVRYEPAYYVVDYSTDGRQEPSYRINNDPIPQEDIIHLRSPFSRSPLSLASEAIGTAKQLEKYLFTFFKNAARPGGVIETPKTMGDEGVKKMLLAWRSAHSGPENAGRTPVLYDGASFRQMGMTSTDSQFMENRKEQVVEIARAFRVPPSMLFELDRATWSNSEQMGKEFLTYCLEPWLQALEGAMRRALFTADERQDYRIVFDRDDLTRADLTARATAISSLISSRVINPNEGRNWLGLPSYDGGDKFENPHINTSAPADEEDA